MALPNPTAVSSPAPPMAVKPIVPVAVKPATATYPIPNFSDYLYNAAAQDYQKASSMSPAAAFGYGGASPVRVPVEAAVSAGKAALAPLSGLTAFVNQAAGGAFLGADRPLISSVPAPVAKVAPNTKGQAPTQVAASTVLDPRAEAMKGLLGLGTRQDLDALISAPLTRYSPAEEAIRNIQTTLAQRNYQAALATAKTPDEMKKANEEYGSALSIAMGGAAATTPTLLSYMSGYGPLGQ